MNSLSGAAVLNRRRTASPMEESPPVLEETLQWATVSNSRSGELAGVKTVSFDPESSSLFATHKKGDVLLWNWDKGAFDTFLPLDKDKDDMVRAVLCVGDALWVSSGKGKIIIYDVETLKPITKVVAHTAEVFCMIKISGSGPAKVLTGSIDFTVKVWDEDAMLISHSSHHHGAILCAIQVHHQLAAGGRAKEAGAEAEAEQRHPQIWTGSNDGTIFKWNDVNRDGKVSKDEGTVLKHSTSEAIACMEQVRDAFIWAGTERGKLVVWDVSRDEPVCEMPGVHRDRISAICAMGHTAWTAGADKAILVWSSAGLPDRPRMLYKVDVEIGYVKSMLKIGWGLWVFHNKGLAIYSSASALEMAQDRCYELEANVRELQSHVEDLDERVATSKEVEESLQYQMQTLSTRQEKSAKELEGAQKELSSAKSELEEARRQGEVSSAESAGAMESKEAELRAKEEELGAMKHDLEALGEARREEEERARERERDGAKAAGEERAKLEGEVRSKASEVEQMGKKVSELQDRLAELDAEKRERDGEVSALKKKLEEDLASERQGKDSEIADLQKSLEALRSEGEGKVAKLESALGEERRANEAKIADLEKALASERGEKEEKVSGLQSALDGERKEREAQVASLQSALDGERSDSKAKVADLEKKIDEFDRLAREREDDSRKALEQTDSHKKDLETKLSDALRGAKDAEEEVKRLRDQIAGKDERIQALEESVEGLSGKAKAMESELSTKDRDLEASAAEIASLHDSQKALQDSSKALEEARSQVEREKGDLESRLQTEVAEIRSSSERERQDMESRLQGERDEMETKAAEMIKSRDEAIREADGRAREVEDGLASLREELTVSNEERAKLQEEASTLAEEVKNLRSNHAKTLLLAGSKHQQILARSRKEMEEQKAEYEEAIKAGESEVGGLQKTIADNCGEYEARLSEMESAAEKVRGDLQKKEGECEQHKQDALARNREFEERAASREQAHSEEVSSLNVKIAGHDEELDRLRHDHERKLREKENEKAKLRTLYEDMQASAKLLEKEIEEIDKRRKDFEERLVKEQEEKAMFKASYEQLQASVALLEQELAKIQVDFDQAETRIKEYHEMVVTQKEIHADQTKILVAKHDKEVKDLNDVIVQLMDDVGKTKVKYEEKIEGLVDGFKKEKDTLKEAHAQEVEEYSRSLQEQKDASDLKIRTLLEKYREEIESLNKASKDVEARLLAHIRKIEEEKAALESDLARTKEDLQTSVHNEELSHSKLESLLAEKEELEATVKKNAAEKERIFMEHEDLRSLLESTRGANPLAYANMFHPDGIDVALYTRTLKQDIFNTVANLTKEITSLKHDMDACEKTIAGLQEQVKATEEALEKKRKKKRKWKMAYLRLSASHSEDVNELQAQLQQSSDQLQSQQLAYKKSQAALRQAAHQLQHAKGLEGALDQAQGEYAQLLTKLSSVRQQAESEKRESRAKITQLQTELDAKTRMFEEAMSEMSQEVNVLKEMSRKKEEEHAAYEAARRLREEDAAHARRQKEEAEERPDPSCNQRERYSGFMVC